MTNEEYIHFLNTVQRLPEKYYKIIKEGILQINDDKKQLLEIINYLTDLIDKATTYYYKTLSQYNNQNKKMPDEAVEMFNLLENNKWLKNTFYTYYVGNFLRQF